MQSPPRKQKAGINLAVGLSCLIFVFTASRLDAELLIAKNFPPKTLACYLGPKITRPYSKVQATGVFFDQNGAGDIKVTRIDFIDKTHPQHKVSVYYHQRSNMLYICNDSKTAWLGGYEPGSKNIIENSFFRLYCSESSVSTPLPNKLIVRCKLAFKKTTDGDNFKIRLFAKDFASLTTGNDKYFHTLVIDGTRPVINSFIASDKMTNNENFTYSQDIAVSITETDPGSGARKWLIRESKAMPSRRDFILTQQPTTYTFTGTYGRVKLYCWVMDNAGNISALTDKSQAQIYYIREPVKHP